MLKEHLKKRLEKIIEEATIDCYDEYEQFAGFVATLESDLSFPFEAEILGKKVTVKGIKEKENRVVAKIFLSEGKKDRIYEVDILDLKNIDDSKNSEVNEAYRLWRNEYS